MNDKLHKNTLWLDLLNSDWHDYKGKGKHEDRLDKKGWYEMFVSRWPIVNPDDARESLRGLRKLLRRMTDDFSRRIPLSKPDLDILNHIMGKSPIVKKVVPAGQAYALMPETKTSGIHSVLAEIASSFAEILISGESERIKICQNPDCLWIFYDNSKNHSRKWCENATGCGNLMKVRMIRAKAKKKLVKRISICSRNLKSGKSSG